MSLSGALSSALSGLTANSRAAGLVSSNVSNALTEGYGRRELATSGLGPGYAGGVRIDGVIRHGNPVVLADRRLSDAETGRAQHLQDFAARIERMAGDVTDTGSLSGRMAALENALISAASNPASTHRLDALSRAAEGLADSFNDLSRGLQTARQDTDRGIRVQIDTLNENLNRVETLNARILSATRQGRDASSLIDQRQTSIDTIAQFVPLRSVARDGGGVALFTTGGAILLDGKAATLEFAQTSIILPHMTQSNGLLSGLSINGKAVDTSDGGPLAGGALGALFQIRDEAAVEFQSRLDGIARDVIDRLGAGGPDGTISTAGMFTDSGGAFVASDETGIAGRITLNAALTVANGETWRLRDGLGAANPGEVGEARLLNLIHAALTEPVPPASRSLDGTSRSAAAHLSEWSSGIAAFRVEQDSRLSFAKAQNVSLSELERADGVDTDQELQFLMRLEQSFQANAKVMTTVDEMLQTVLSI